MDKKTKTDDVKRCECGVPIREDQDMCAVCKALYDRAKRKAKAKAKAKDKKKKMAPELLAKVESAVTAVELELSGLNEDDRNKVVRKLIGALCESLPTTRVDVTIPDVKGKDGAASVVYTIQK